MATVASPSSVHYFRALSGSNHSQFIANNGILFSCSTVVNSLRNSIPIFWRFTTVVIQVNYLENNWFVQQSQQIGSCVIFVRVTKCSIRPTSQPLIWSRCRNRSQIVWNDISLDTAKAKKFDILKFRGVVLSYSKCRSNDCWTNTIIYFNLFFNTFNYISSLHRSHWTLCCQNVS